MALAIHVEYAAPSSCPSEAQFLEHVSARSAVRSAPSGQPAPTLRIAIHRTGARFEGEIRLNDEPAPRRLDGSNCAAVVEGLALVASVMIESVAPVDSADPTPRQASTERPATEPPAETVASAAETRARRWATGLNVAAAGYAAPLIGAAAFIELELGDARSWRPSVRVSPAFLTTGATELGSGGARFTLVALRIEGCPLTWRHAAFSLSPCLHLEGGQMTADGLARGEVVEPRSSHAAWLGTGLDARMRVRFGETLFAELAGGLTAALLRRSYVFDNPREVVYTTPALIPSSRVGLGVSLP